MYNFALMLVLVLTACDSAPQDANTPALEEDVLAPISGAQVSNTGSVNNRVTQVIPDEPNLTTTNGKPATTKGPGAASGSGSGSSAKTESSTGNKSSQSTGDSTCVAPKPMEGVTVWLDASSPRHRARFDAEKIYNAGYRRVLYNNGWDPSSTDAAILGLLKSDKSYKQLEIVVAAYGYTVEQLIATNRPQLQCIQSLLFPSYASEKLGEVGLSSLELPVFIRDFELTNKLPSVIDIIASTGFNRVRKMNFLVCLEATCPRGSACNLTLDQRFAFKLFEGDEVGITSATMINLNWQEKPEGNLIINGSNYLPDTYRTDYATFYISKGQPIELEYNLGANEKFVSWAGCTTTDGDKCTIEAGPGSTPHVRYTIDKVD